ncbi:MAG: hypothetical protein ACREF9_02970 [Opitutaceae bacterium]
MPGGLHELSVRIGRLEAKAEKGERQRAKAMLVALTSPIGGASG